MLYLLINCFLLIIYLFVYNEIVIVWLNKMKKKNLSELFLLIIIGKGLE